MSWVNRCAANGRDRPDYAGFTVTRPDDSVHGDLAGVYGGGGRRPGLKQQGSSVLLQSIRGVVHG
jgi:hypothetical protein